MPTVTYLDDEEGALVLRRAVEGRRGKSVFGKELVRRVVEAGGQAVDLDDGATALRTADTPFSYARLTRNWKAKGRIAEANPGKMFEPPLTPVMRTIAADIMAGGSPRLVRAGDKIVGSSGEMRTRLMKTAKGLKEVKTHVAKAVDPKVYKAQQRALRRQAEGRWDGRPK